MAYTTTTMQHQRSATLALLAAVAVLLATTTHAVAAATTTGGGCEGDKLMSGKSYAHCAALPYLGAKLHWTYDAKTGSLSVAFVAKPPPPSTTGWISWAINPTGQNMAGAQALLAMKTPSSSSSYVVNTYNLTGYAALGPVATPITYKASELAADEQSGGGEMRLYGKLQLAPGLEQVNHIWQVGSTVTSSGAPAKHAFAKENLEAKGRLVLSSGAVMPVEAAPAPAPAPMKGGGGGGGAASAPSGGKSAAAAPVVVTMSAPALALLALVGFLAM